MGRMTWHLATPQRLEPVGPDRGYGPTAPAYTGLVRVVRRRAGVIGMPRRPRLTAPARARTGPLAASLSAG